MKTLSKILISILALALCIGAAAVTVFAAEETSFVTVGLGDFEEATVGQSLTGSGSNTNIDGVLFAVNGRRGQYTVTQAENGNKYIVHAITSEGHTTTVPYMSINEKAPTQSANYGDAALSNNLFYSIDFDMMTPTGSYPMHSSGNITMQVAPYFARYDASFNRATDGTASVLTFGGTGRNTWTQGSNSYVMDTTAGEWHHITVVIEMPKTAGGEVDLANVKAAKMHLYVDGKPAFTTEGAFASAIDYSNSASFYNGDTGYAALGEVRINFSRENGSGKSDAYDNFTVSRFPVGYTGTVSDVAAAIYNDDYDMPYEKALCTVDGVSFGSFTKAFSAVKENSKVVLMSDCTNYTVAVAHTLDTNGFSCTVNSDIVDVDSNGDDDIRVFHPKAWYAKALLNVDFQNAAVKVHSSNVTINGALLSLGNIRGKYEVKLAGNGTNRYLTMIPSMVNCTSGANRAYLNLPLTSKTPTASEGYGADSIIANRYYSIDLDMMTPTTYPANNFYIAPYIRVYGGAAGSTPTSANFVSHQLTFNGTAWVEGDKSYVMDTTPGKWHHVTLIVEAPVDENGKVDPAAFESEGFDFHLYVDGKFAFTYENAYGDNTFDYSNSANYYGGDYSYAALESFRLNFSNSGYPSAVVEEIAIDNVKSHSFSTEYKGDLSSIASTVYNKDYEMPYGFTVASVDGANYDSFEKAFAAVSAGSVVELLADCTEAQKITAICTVKTNGYSFNYDSNGFSVEHVEGVYTFKEAEYFTVSWIGKDGAVLHTEQVIGGTAATPFNIEGALSTTAYYKVDENLWSVEGIGGAICTDFTVTEDTEFYQTFKVLPYFTGAKYNLSLMGHIRINLFIPLADQLPEGVSVQGVYYSVADAEAETGALSLYNETVNSFGGVLYHNYTPAYPGATALNQDNVAVIKYTAIYDGNEYTLYQELNLNALTYIKVILKDSEKPEEQQSFADAYTMVADLLRYSRDLTNAALLSKPSANVQQLLNSRLPELNSLLETYGKYLSDTAEVTFPASTADYSELDEYLGAIYFNLQRYEPAFMLTFDKAGVKNVEFRVYGDNGEYNKYLYNASSAGKNEDGTLASVRSANITIYDIDRPVTIIITVDDGEGGEKQLSGTYDLNAYYNGMQESEELTAAFRTVLVSMRVYAASATEYRNNQ